MAPDLSAPRAVMVELQPDLAADPAGLSAATEAELENRPGRAGIAARFQIPCTNDRAENAKPTASYCKWPPRGHVAVVTLAW
jgi:hypothetical protein